MEPVPEEPVVERVADVAARAPRERPLVELKNVAAGYTDPSGARVEVAHDLNLTLGRGEMAYLIGPTGSGLPQ